MFLFSFCEENHYFFIVLNWEKNQLLNHCLIDPLKLKIKFLVIITNQQVISVFIIFGIQNYDVFSIFLQIYFINHTFLIQIFN